MSEATVVLDEKSRGWPFSEDSAPAWHPRLRFADQKNNTFYKRLAAAFLLLLILIGACGHINLVRQPPPAQLTFTKEGTFQINIFEDLHFGENAWEQWGPQQDINTLKVMNTVLDAESPQLVVLNGDLITGENVFLENSTDYVDVLVEPMAKRKIPWASTYGNHDSNFNISREGILARERTYPHAMTDQMVFSPNAGVSNYWLPVFPYDNADEPCLFLWFFDSRGGSYFQQGDIAGKHIEQPNWVDEYVVDWFKGFNDWLVKRHSRVIPSLAFVHIPTNATRAYQTEVGPRPHYEPGINDDYPLAQQSQGWCADGSHNRTCAYGGQDLPFMRAIASTPGLMALFSGHDHGDSWCFKWDSALSGMDFAGNGVNLCFGQHTGYGGYGRWIRGARQILVTQEMLKRGELDNWIRLEDRSTVGSVTLNSTYGRDWYEKTPNKHTKCPACE